MRRLALVVLFPILPARAAASPGVDEAIARILSRPELKTSTVGIYAARLKTGEAICGLNAEKLLAPASNTKLVSCAGALMALGKDFRFKTRVVTKASLESGTLHGDVTLVASGDPNLSQRITSDGRLLFEDKDHSYAGFYDATLVKGDPLAVLRDLARQVAGAGVKEIRGDVVVDDGLFEETEDEFVGPVSAVCVNDNLVDVIVTPGDRPGEPARYEPQPRGHLVEVTSSAKTVPAGGESALWLEPREGQATFDLSGTIPVGSGPVLRSASFRKPAVAAAGFLLDALREAGVRVSGVEKQRRQGPAAYAKDRELALHTSPPLSEALRVTLKVSQNLHATMLPIVVGALRGERGDRWSGYGVIGRLFAERGLDTDAVVIQSGSGGGRGDHMTARWAVDLLRSMSTRDDFPLFLGMLPVGGVDGTLAGAFADPTFAQRIHAKTGTLVYRGALGEKWIYVSKSLSGYLDCGESARADPATDNLIAFSIIIANTLVSGRKKGSEDLFRAQEDILRVLFDGTVRAKP